MKVGDKVKIVGTPAMCAGHEYGDVGTITHKDYAERHDSCVYDFGVTVKGRVGRYNTDELQLIEEKTMNPYKKGQLLTREGNVDDMYTVIEVLGDLVFLSEPNTHEEFYATFHYKELEGYTIQDPTDIKEVTIDEIAKQFNVPVDNIRIKE